MSVYKMPTRAQNSNKGTFGKVLNFCGSENYIGAAYLSTISSLKVGAGLSALATEQQVINSVSSILPEAVYLTRKQGLEKLNDFTVVLIGCGLGVNNETKALLENVLANIYPDIPLIIDADGLSLLAKMYNQLNKNTILTPHPLEAARLLNYSLTDVLNDLEGAAKKITEKYNCVTVLKTYRSVISDTDFNIHINRNGNSGLAKGGSGDVLAGIIAGLLAQGMDCFEACKLGVYLHARAGEIASENLTEYSVLASDVINNLPFAIKEIL